jgi:hypothetical protein
MQDLNLAIANIDFGSAGSGCRVRSEVPAWQHTHPGSPSGRIPAAHRAADSRIAFGHALAGRFTRAAPVLPATEPSSRSERRIRHPGPRSRRRPRPTPAPGTRASARGAEALRRDRAAPLRLRRRGSACGSGARVARRANVGTGVPPQARPRRAGRPPWSSPASAHRGESCPG